LKKEFSWESDNFETELASPNYDINYVQLFWILPKQNYVIG